MWNYRGLPKICSERLIRVDGNLLTIYGLADPRHIPGGVCSFVFAGFCPPRNKHTKSLISLGQNFLYNIYSLDSTLIIITIGPGAHSPKQLSWYTKYRETCTRFTNSTPC